MAELRPPLAVGESRPCQSDDHRTLYAMQQQPSASIPADAESPTSTSQNVVGVEDNHVPDAPPFWTANRHARSVSSVSYHSIVQLRPQPIQLEDHSEEDYEQTQACWARSVTVDEYSCISGPTGVGAYIIWHCTISTLKGGELVVRKRYSEFDKLRTDLVLSFPHAAAMIPQLPRKSVVSRFRLKFLEQRKAGLIHFLNCILLNPEFAGSPVLKDFIFA